MRMVRPFAMALVPLLLLGCSSKGGLLPELTVLAEEEIVWEGWTPAWLVAAGDTVECKVHYRGGISSGFPKHSMAVRFVEGRALCGLPEDRDFILNASYVDKTFLRHKLCYDLFVAMNPDVNRAPTCAYAMLHGGDEPMGLYVVMQKLDASTLCIDKGDSSSVIFKDPPLFYESVIVPQDSDNYYQQTYPKKRREDRTAQIERLRCFVFESDEATFCQQVPFIMDLDNIVDWHILLMLSNNSDGLLKNFFLYKRDDKSPYRIALWDYDHSFGRDGDNTYNMLNDTVDINRCVLLRRLWQWEAYRQRVAARWKQLRDEGTISEVALCGRIDSEVQKIRSAVMENESIWPVDSEFYKDANGFDQEIEIMKQFVGLNVTRLDRLFGLADIVTASPKNGTKMKK